MGAHHGAHPFSLETMPYQTNPDVSFCRIGGNLVFLDVARDRYFRLPPSLENEFVHAARGAPQDTAALDALIGLEVIVASSDTRAGIHPVTSTLPSTSLLEQGHIETDRALKVGTFLEVLAHVVSMRLRLSFQPLSAVLANASVYRDTKTATYAARAPANFTADLQTMTQLFRRARRLVPIEPVCLLDSLALLHFLARRGLPANLIFGIALNPFSAHCWLQAGETALNESLTVVAAHTPIRIV